MNWKTTNPIIVCQNVLNMLMRILPKNVKRSILVAFLFNSLFNLNAQQILSLGEPKGWHLLDKDFDGYSGISLNEAYQYLNGRKSQTVIVAVIDGGIDTTHEDLSANLWRNLREIPNNGIDDDKNGYVDDVYGWNFLGRKGGENQNYDFTEAARLYLSCKSNHLSIPKANCTKIIEEFIKTYKEAKIYVESMNFRLTNFKRWDSVLRKSMKKEMYNGYDLQNAVALTEDEKDAKGAILSLYIDNKTLQFKNSDLLNDLTQRYMVSSNICRIYENSEYRDPRVNIVRDNEKEISDINYGNNDVMSSTPLHGTHVAGIIGAVRGNNKGVDGIANSVKIMTLRVVPFGDERDKDVALAIRYAVDNGAKIINLSFGKYFSPQKKWVDEAVKYAEIHDVLIVHAAGNDAKNLDQNNGYPNQFINDDTTQRVKNWINVGASENALPSSYRVAAIFSNYSKYKVDVFAPGVNINSTLPGNTYGMENGTSMAAPVVSGVAALILSYFPDIKSTDLKEIIMNSVQKINFQVTLPGIPNQKASFSDLCISGGIVNAYAAVKLAESLTK